ncbi:MAG: hypothetical protein ACXAEF_13400, partial [Candidatus Thorarchaeota archaeon]
MQISIMKQTEPTQIFRNNYTLPDEITNEPPFTKLILICRLLNSSISILFATTIELITCFFYNSDMRTLSVVSLILLLILVIPVNSPAEIQTIGEKNILAQDDVVERDWYINLVLVNYDQSLIDESVLLIGLPTERVHNADPITIQYNLHYEVYYTNESYTNSIRQLILDNSINGTDTGTQLDEAALQYHKDNINDPQTIFYPRDGRSIDAVVIEDWLEENPYVTPPGLGYMFYVFNFTEFDSSDHSLEHWYDYNPIDIDTAEKQNWFRLEWDNALNPDVMFEYPAFGGRHNLYVLDPSADQWYLKWCRIWWNTQVDYEYMSKDLDQKVSEIDLSTPAGISALNMYLNQYIQDPVEYLFAPASPIRAQNDVTAFVESGYLNSLVICMDTATGTSVDSLEWVTNAEIQQTHLEGLLPFIDWEVDVEFLDIEDSTAWTDLFWDYAEVIGGRTIVDGYGMFEAIRNFMRWQYVDIYDPNINVFGVVFIKKDMEMHVYGRQYTGLGGDGQTVIWKSWDRYYRPDEVTPKAGISLVQLHETMHAIGLGHTWDVDHYVADFSYTPMGYYGRYNGTGKFDQAWVQGTYLDQMQGRLWLDFQDKRDLMSSVPRDITTAIENQILDAFVEAENLYNQMDWQGCYDELENVDEWIERFMYSMTDHEAPEIVKWGFNGSIFAEDITVWATVM